MSGTPDPALIDATAARVADYAAALRARSAALAHTAAACRWDGPAARAFQAAATQVVGELHAAGRQFDLAAEALHRHATEVRADLARQCAELHAVGHALGFDR
jgi:uncharacterized protein YukE